MPEADAPESTNATTAAAESENPSLIAFTLTPPPDVYFYGPESSTGLPTKAVASFAPISPFSEKPIPGDAGFSALLSSKGTQLSVRLPDPIPKDQTAFSESAGFGTEPDTPIYPGPITFWVEIPSLRPFYQNAALEVSVSGLFCTETSCLPFDEVVSVILDIPMIAEFAIAEEQPWWNDWQEGIAVQLSTDGLAVVDTGTNHQQPAVDDSSEKGLFAAFAPEYANPNLEVTDLGGALFFGLIAGLLLNLMPCVLPVISLKFTALMAVSTMENKHERASAFRVHCIIFAMGILTWFVVLAILLGTAGWAWGELFQSPHVVMVLAIIMFLLALSLFGVYTLPILDLKITSDKHPHLQSFGSGLLATLLATPCSGPLLGGVIAWALRQPLPMLVLAVGSVGIGMALPYFVLALSPRLVHLLPRPGGWTLRLEQLLGFFLFGSVIYMVTLLPTPWISSFLFVLLAVAMASWLWGQIGHLGASRLRRYIARCAAILVVLGSVGLWSLTSEEDNIWEPFNPLSFEEMLGKEAMLVEFTADWCPSCKALEYTTLNNERMEYLRNKYNVRIIRVDLTRNDPVAKEFLLSLGSASIPVIALFPVGEGAEKPLVLRDIVTPSQLEAAAMRMF